MRGTYRGSSIESYTKAQLIEIIAELAEMQRQECAQHIHELAVISGN